MRYLDLTLPTAAENLALDEALLEEAEAAGAPTETLRLWESPQPLVVVGRSSRIDAEVRVDACRALGISHPAARQRRGGHRRRAGLPDVRPGAQLSAAAAAAQCSARPIATCWARWRRRWNRWRRACNAAAPATWPSRAESSPATAPAAAAIIFLYHGTLLYDFPLELIERCLTMPPRMPDYRDGRPHDGFVANLPLSAETIRQAIRGRGTPASVAIWPKTRTARLVAEKYSRPEWNG